jgi:enterochelin esterase family protein
MGSRAEGAPAACPAPGPHVDPGTGAISFVATDEGSAHPRRVWYHLRDFGDDPAFVRCDAGWVATIPRPPVDRLEYLLVVADPDGHESMVLDPANPDRVPGVFGDHSQLLLPAYRPPVWLGHRSSWATRSFHMVGEPEVHGTLCSPCGAGDEDELALLVVHDGPEYATLARLLDYLDWCAQGRPGRRARVLLLAPGRRNLEYSADPDYCKSLIEAIAQVCRTVGTATPVIGVGASLGALALLHAAVSSPGTFGGLFCQSGSFFLPRFDAHERRFEYYQRVVDFVDRVDSDPARLAGLQVALTAGLGEENLENNRALAARLLRHGVPVTLAEGPDGHNQIAWRDLLHPALALLMDRSVPFPSAG